MKLYLPTSAEPVSWRQWKTRKANQASWAADPMLTGKLAVYKAIAEAQTGISRTDIITATGLKPHTVSFYLSKFKGQGFISVKGEAPGAAHHSATSINMSFDDAKVAALLALENALVIKAKERGITDDMRTAFVVYQKVKAKVLTPPDPSASAAEQQGVVVEASSALKLALRKLLDMLF